MKKMFDGAVHAWTEGVEFDERAQEQVRNMASLPFVTSPIAIMPDVHWGIGATIGSVVPTYEAIIPAAVGVDIGCGMAAIRTGLDAADLPDSLAGLRGSIEDAVPVGFASHETKVPHVKNGEFLRPLGYLLPRHKKIKDQVGGNIWDRVVRQVGTLGSGNHFIEICTDQTDGVWIMLHSGSRGIGNVLGQYFIELAKEDMREHVKNLPDSDLAYFFEGTNYFNDYVQAVVWSQDYARYNRGVMCDLVADAIKLHVPKYDKEAFEIHTDCHHNYVQREHHHGRDLWMTRKGAVRVRKDEWGIIPGSMGDCSYIVQGKGNADAYDSCSHGAGRRMSRTQAKKEITLDEHVRATEGVECRKDAGVLDESPAAYKDIDAVMAAQEDLVSIKYTLKQMLCIKG